MTKLAVLFRKKVARPLTVLQRRVVCRVKPRAEGARARSVVPRGWATRSKGTFVDNKDGTYSIGFFELAGNDWRTTPFSPLESYLAGWAPASEIAPIISMQDAMPVKYTDTRVIVTWVNKQLVLEAQIEATEERDLAEAS